MFEFGNVVAVKVCGITGPADALSCATAGVEMLGLNFSPQSLRCVSPKNGMEIVAAVRARFDRTRFVGVFVDQELELVHRIATELTLDAVQLHGAEPPGYVRELNGLFVIKTLRVGTGFETATAAAYHCDAILLDTWNASVPGGTGETFPWAVAVGVQSHVRRLILAGGLTSSNVSEAVRTVRPFAVDVCSGTEEAPGRKNSAKVQQFIKAVRDESGDTHG